MGASGKEALLELILTKRGRWQGQDGAGTCERREDTLPHGQPRQSTVAGGKIILLQRRVWLFGKSKAKGGTLNRSRLWPGSTTANVDRCGRRDPELFQLILGG